MSEEKIGKVLDLAKAERSPYASERTEVETQEISARKFARALARKIGDDEWHQGNTKYAFEAYEAACVAPSEILAKAEALLKAESLARGWENELKHLIEGPIVVEECRTYETRNLLGYADVLAGASVYCPSDDCFFCSQKRVLNRSYANKIHDALGWEHPDPKEREANNLSGKRQEVIEDSFSEYFLYSSDKPKQKYRAAAVAALKLVSRLEKIYITEKPENGPLVHGDSIIA